MEVAEEINLSIPDQIDAILSRYRIDKRAWFQVFTGIFDWVANAQILRKPHSQIVSHKGDLYGNLGTFSRKPR